MIIAGIVPLLSTPIKFQPSDPPLFVYPIVFVLGFLFTLVFFKCTSMNVKLTPGKINTWSFSIFRNPLPFYHLCAIVSIIEGVMGAVRAILNMTKINPESLFALSLGPAVYLSVYIANKRFIHEVPKLKKV